MNILIWLLILSYTFASAIPNRASDEDADFFKQVLEFANWEQQNSLKRNDSLKQELSPRILELAGTNKQAIIISRDGSTKVIDTGDLLTTGTNEFDDVTVVALGKEVKKGKHGKEGKHGKQGKHIKENEEEKGGKKVKVEKPMWHVGAGVYVNKEIHEIKEIKEVPVIEHHCTDSDDSDHDHDHDCECDDDDDDDDDDRKKKKKKLWFLPFSIEDVPSGAKYQISASQMVSRANPDSHNLFTGQIATNPFLPQRKNISSNYIRPVRVSNKPLVHAHKDAYFDDTSGVNTIRTDFKLVLLCILFYTILN